jgi:hypothetical protein
MMDIQQAEMWNQRYKLNEYVYGKEPNNFLKSKIENLRPGTALFPADGEGRNSVYAATLGWKCNAFDISEEGMNKAMHLANNNNVAIDYKIGDFRQMGYLADSFDLLVFIFAHFQGSKKIGIHLDLNSLLKPGGMVIFEAFSKKHIDFQAIYPNIGGPRDIEMLWSKDEIKLAFPQFKIVELEEQEVELHEGNFHEGKGSVIRFLGIKN